MGGCCLLDEAVMVFQPGGGVKVALASAPIERPDLQRIATLRE
jgi:hypothetical protein